MDRWQIQLQMAQRCIESSKEKYRIYRKTVTALIFKAFWHCLLQTEQKMEVHSRFYKKFLWKVILINFFLVCNSNHYLCLSNAEAARIVYWWTNFKATCNVTNLEPQKFNFKTAGIGVLGKCLTKHQRPLNSNFQSYICFETWLQTTC